MNRYLENFVNLFSEDDATVIKAVKEKKDWMFRKLYLKVRFDKVDDEKIPYPEIFAAMDNALHFETLKGTSKVIKSFNESFRFKTLSEQIKLEKDSFLIELNMNALDDKAYRDLLGNFYPCMPIEELEIVNDGSVLNLLKLPMIGSYGDWVLILGKDQLIRDNYYFPYFKKVIYDKALLNEDEIATIKEIAENHNLPIEEKQSN